MSGSRMPKQGKQGKSIWRLIAPETPSPPESAPKDGGKESRKLEPPWYPLVAEAMVRDRQVWQTACTRAIPIGDKINGPQWTNPDVVGWIEPEPAARVLNFPTKLVAVEVKRQSDQNSLLTGFAEACAYLDFAHVSWLVVPWCEGSAIERVARLCAIHGLGLAYAHEEEDKMLSLEVGVLPRCHNPGAHEIAGFLMRLKEAGIE